MGVENTKASSYYLNSVRGRDTMCIDTSMDACMYVCIGTCLEANNRIQLAESFNFHTKTIKLLYQLVYIVTWYYKLNKHLFLSDDRSIKLSNYILSIKSMKIVKLTPFDATVDFSYNRRNITPSYFSCYYY